MATIFALVAISDRTLSSHLAYATANALVTFFAVRIVTGHVAAVGDVLEVVNVLVTVRLERSEVAGVSGDNGLVIRTTAGEEIESTVYGSSVLQRFVSSRRYAMAARQIRAWAAAPAVEGRRHGARRSLRDGALTTLAGSMAAWLAVGWLLYAVNDTLWPLIAGS